MKIGAQMYTIREFCKTPEDTIKSLEKLAEIGYDAVHYSGCGPMVLNCCGKLVID